MIEFRVLGSSDLRTHQGDEISAVLSQPLRTALLVFLALEAPQGYHRRDRLIGLFWQESRQDRARASLRRALHFLRKALGREVLIGRGDEEVSLNWDRFWCDAVAFQEASENGDLTGALDLYRGDLLPGFFVSGCPDFEQWLETERVRLREMAADAAWELAHRHLADGSITAAERMGQKALGLLCSDENEVRRFVGALADAGDRAAALRFYQRFAHLLRETLELNPSEETVGLVRSIQGGDAGDTQAPGLDRVPDPTRPLAPSSAEPGEAEKSVRATPATEAVSPEEPARRDLAVSGSYSAPRFPWRAWPWVALPAGGVAALVSVVLLGLLGPGPDVDPLAENERVLVLPLENRSGRLELDDVGPYLSEWVADRLILNDEVQAFDGQLAAEAMASYEEPPTSRRVAADLHAGFFVHGTYDALGDTLLVRVRLVRTRDAEAIFTDEIRGLVGGEEALAEAFAESLLGALAVSQDPTASHWFQNPPTYRAFQLFRQGRERFHAQDWAGAIPYYLEAYELDSTFVAVLNGVAGALSNSGQLTRLDSVLAIIEPRRDRLTPYGRAWYEHFSANLRGDREAALEVWRVEYRRSPDGLGRAYSWGNVALRAGHPHEAYRALKLMDLNHPWHKDLPFSWQKLSEACHLTDHYGEEMEAARDGLARFPRDWLLRRYEIRALAGNGAWRDVPPLLDSVEALEPDRQGNPGDLFRWLAVDLARLGHTSRATELALRALNWYEAHEQECSDLLPRGGCDPGRARALLLMDRPHEALIPTQGLVETSPTSMTAHGLYGMALAASGDTAGAWVEDAWFEALDRSYMLGSNTLWRAAIQAHLGLREDAVRLLGEALNEGAAWYPLPLDSRFRPLWGYKPFERIMAPSS